MIVEFPTTQCERISGLEANGSILNSQLFCTRITGKSFSQSLSDYLGRLPIGDKVGIRVGDEGVGHRIELAIAKIRSQLRISNRKLPVHGDDGESVYHLRGIDL